MKIVGGILFFVAGLALAAFVGIYLCLVGGIVEIVHGATAHPVDAGGIAFGAVRVLCTGVASYLSALVGFIPGVVLIKKALA